MWLYMRKERFSVQRRSKLLMRGDGPFQVLECIKDNVYKLDLPCEYNDCVTFNVSDLSPFDVGDDLRTNPFQKERNHEDMPILESNGGHGSDLVQVPVGPMRRARAKHFKEGLHGLVQEAWSNKGTSWRTLEVESKFINMMGVIEPSKESQNWEKRKSGSSPRRGRQGQ